MNDDYLFIYLDLLWFLILICHGIQSSIGIHRGLFSGGNDGLVIYLKAAKYTVSGSCYHWWAWDTISTPQRQSIFFCSVAQSCPTLWDPIDCSMPSFPVHCQLLDFTQTHVHWVSDAIQPSHPLSSPSLPAFNLSQHQGHFQWVSPSHQVVKVLELQLQHQSFQWIFRVDFL